MHNSATDAKPGQTYNLFGLQAGINSGHMDNLFGSILRSRLAVCLSYDSLL